MRFFLALTALSLTHPALADEACLAAPTRDCLLQHAMETALSTDKMEDVAAGLLGIAASQEAAGLPASSDTVTLLFDRLVALETQQGDALSALMYGSSQVEDALAAAPKTALGLAQVFEGTGPVVLSFPDDAAIAMAGGVRAYGLAGDLAGIRRVIKKHGYVDQFEMLELGTEMLIRGNHIESALALNTGPGQWYASVEVDFARLKILLERGDLDEAAAVARTVADANGWTDLAMAQVALAYAIEGSPKAEELSDQIVLFPHEFMAGDTQNYAPLNSFLAVVHATAGDREKAKEALAKAATETGPDEALNAWVDFALAVRAHDVTTALTLLETGGGKIEIWRSAKEIGQIIATLEPAEQEKVLAVLGESRTTALHELALVQIRRGEIREAAAKARLLKVTGKDELVIQLARAFLKAGDREQAMEWAALANSAELFAELALKLDDAR